MSDLLHYHVWRRPDMEFPDQFQYMLVDMVRGRCVTSVLLAIDPLKRSTLRLWCRQEEPGVILAGRDRANLERPSYYRDDGGTTFWRWSADGEEFPFTMVTPDDVPGWFTELVEKAYARMDGPERDHTHNRGVAS